MLSASPNVFHYCTVWAKDFTVAGIKLHQSLSSPFQTSMKFNNFRLFAMMKPDEVAERDVFLASALRWSASCRSSGNQHFKTGHPLLHRSIAQIYWQGEKCDRNGMVTPPNSTLHVDITCATS